MSGHVAAIFRHPVKGFTPERLETVTLAPGEGFPADRIYAVENGPCGFDPSAPAHVPKQKFTVLAHMPRVASARTRFDDATGTLHVSAEGIAPLSADLGVPEGRVALEGWLTEFLGEDVRGALKVLAAPGRYRFTDHPKGQVSIINLATLRDLSRAMGAELDPMRFRANLYVEGWPAWAENDWVGERLALGGAEAEVFKPIVRCAATHVDPTTAVRDLDINKALFDNYGHMHCGIYVQVTRPGKLGIGDMIPAPRAQA